MDLQNLPDNQKFIHIDTQLKASHYRLMVWLGILVMLMMVVSLLGLPLSIRIALGLLLIVSILLSQLATNQLLAMSCLTAKRKRHTIDQEVLLPEIDWQIQCIQGYLFTPFGQTTDIYQAKLINIENIGMVMLVGFLITQPFEKTLHFIVWQDQVDSNTWRQMKVIATQ